MRLLANSALALFLATAFATAGEINDIEFAKPGGVSLTRGTRASGSARGQDTVRGRIVSLGASPIVTLGRYGPLLKRPHLATRNTTVM